MRVFLDFEASSLADDSYPIEVGWVFEDGAVESHLIRPNPDWLDWDDEAQALHGISREQLLREGASAQAVANRILQTLSAHRVYASAPSWDGKWLSVLLRGGGLPRHAMRLIDTAEAHREAVAEVFLGGPAQDIEGLARRLADAALAGFEAPPRHRALDDAQRELALWREIRRLAEVHKRTTAARG